MFECWLCFFYFSGWWSKRKLSGRWVQMLQNWGTWRKRKGILNGWKTKGSKWQLLFKGVKKNPQCSVCSEPFVSFFLQLILCSRRVPKCSERLQSGHQTEQKDPGSVFQQGCVSPEAAELSQGHWGFFSGQNRAHWPQCECAVNESGFNPSLFGGKKLHYSSEFDHFSL